MARITSIEALRQLLDVWGWFELANCLSVSPPPGGPATPERVELILRDDITPSINAEVRTFRITRLTANGVREWSFSGQDFCHYATCDMDRAELIETSDGFGLAFDIPTPVCLVAEAFEYERLADETESMPAGIFDGGLTMKAPRTAIPSPRQWVEAFAREGTEVKWRVLGGPAHPVERVSADYTGWFLERPSRLTEHDQGIFVRYTGLDANGITVGLDRYGVDDELWHTTHTPSRACSPMAKSSGATGGSPLRNGSHYWQPNATANRATAAMISTRQ